MIRSDAQKLWKSFAKTLLLHFLQTSIQGNNNAITYSSIKKKKSNLPYMYTWVQLFKANDVVS